MNLSEKDEQLLNEFIDATYKTKYVEQGSEEWQRLRIGRFTSSEIYKIMECGKRPMTPEELAARPKKGKGSATTQVPDSSQMSDKGKKYIRQKAWERLTGQLTLSPYAYALAYGKEMEPEAVEHFERVTGMQTEVVGFQPFSDYAGGSPDRYIGETDILEVKCPVSDEQIDYLMLTDHHDLKRNYPEIYWQIVSLLLFCDRQRGHLITFDPRMKEEKHKMTHLIIEREKVQEDIDTIPKALEGAVKELLSLIQTVS
jgi:hypothetical protein